MIAKFKLSADEMRNKEWHNNHYQMDGFIDPLDNVPLVDNQLFAKKDKKEESFDKIGLLPVMKFQKEESSSFLENDDVN
jgi:hypothetical protein